MKSLQEKFDEVLKRILPQGGKVLLAVSGGPDSIVMAELFLHSKLQLPEGLSFELAHCNFQLRGGDSWSDELFVANWCSSHGVALHRISFDTERYAEEHHLSIEMAARDLRYGWFDQLCQEGNFTAVSVAHNANDNAETLFLNLLRGTGIKGICGMHPKGFLPVPGSHSPLIRPMLTITREEIETYAQDNGILFCVDGTNAETEFKRNRIRHLVFPQLAQINPSFLSTLAADMERFAQVDRIADAYFEAHRTEVLRREAGPAKCVCRISLEALLSLSEPGYMLFRLLEPYGFNATTVHSIFSTISTESTISGKVFHSDGYKIITSSDELLLLENQCDKEEVDGVSEKIFSQEEKVIHNDSEIVDNFSEHFSEEEGVLVNGEGLYEFKGRRFHVLLMDRPENMRLRQPEGTVLWDYAALPFPFVLRSWQKGDWFHPLGLHGRKKLSDLFTDLKYDLLQKEQAVVVVPLEAGDDRLTAGGHPSEAIDQKRASGKPAPATSHIGSLLCLRIDDSLKVTDTTQKVLIVKESFE